MSCIKCEAYVGDGTSGICRLNPPVLIAGRSPISTESFFQPAVYADDGCSKAITKEVVVEKPVADVKPATTTKRNRKK